MYVEITVDEVRAISRGAADVIKDVGADPMQSWITLACEALTQSMAHSEGAFTLGELVKSVTTSVSFAIALQEAARAVAVKEARKCFE